MIKITLNYEQILFLTQTFVGLERCLFYALDEDPPLIVNMMKYIEANIDEKGQIWFRISENTPSELRNELHELLKPIREDIVESLS